MKQHYIKSYKIFENQINIIKTGKIKVKRYCSPNTINTNELRGGTWFSFIDDEKAERYNQDEYKLGGKLLITGEINYKKPFILSNTNTNQVLFDFQLFMYVDIFTKMDKEFLTEIAFEENPKQIIKESLKYSIIDAKLANVIKDFSDFNILNIIVDNLLAKRLKDNNRDVFIRLDQNNDIFEIFDINNLFKEKQFLKNVI
jgi:hypothetical protein